MEGQEKLDGEATFERQIFEEASIGEASRCSSRFGSALGAYVCAAARGKISHIIFKLRLF